jgi:hypothetical protein
MSGDKEKVLEKIRKLLRLATNNPNVNEAAVAAARAQQLMLEHKLAQIDLSATDEDKDDESVLETPFDGGRKGGLTPWRQSLITVVAKNCFCRAILTTVVGPTGRKMKHAILIGSPDDANVTMYVYGYLQGEINRLCRAGDRADKYAFRNAFRRGAVVAIAEKLAAQRRQQSSGEKALMVINRADNAVEQYIQGAYKNLRASRAMRPVKDSGGFHDGYRAGQKMDIPGRDRRPAITAASAKLRAAR